TITSTIQGRTTAVGRQTHDISLSRTVTMRPPRKCVFIGIVWCSHCCLTPSSCAPSSTSSSPDKLSSSGGSSSRNSSNSGRFNPPKQHQHQHQHQHQQTIGGGQYHAVSLRERLRLQLLGLRGGVNFTRRMHSTFSRKQAWETAVKRGKGGFPAPTSWEPMDEEELRVKAENLLTPEIPDPVIEQFVPTRAVLWRRWRGTMLEDTWGATLLNMGAALVVCVACQRLQVFFPRLSEQLLEIDIIWKIHMTLTTFILTFFVSQSYDMWRSVYQTTRFVQGRLYNLLMLTTTHLRRERPPCFEDPATAAAAAAAATDLGADHSGDPFGEARRREASAGAGAGARGGHEFRGAIDTESGGGVGVGGSGSSTCCGGGRRGGGEREVRKGERFEVAVQGVGRGGDVGDAGGVGGGDWGEGEGQGREKGGSGVEISPPPPSPPSPPEASEASGASEACGCRWESDPDGDSTGSRGCFDGTSILPDSRLWLARFERYTRLWHILYYAGCSREHACFCTDPGLDRLYLFGLVTEADLQLLKGFPGPAAHRHMPVFQWMVAFFLEGLEDGRFLQPVSLTTRVMEQFVALRDKYGAIGDMVGGRTKLAYAHAVQLLVDVFLFLPPFALFSEVGFWAIIATGVLTTFYQASKQAAGKESAGNRQPLLLLLSGLFNLSKAFIDPLNNEDATIDSDCIIIDSLIKESANMGGRWTSGAVVFLP
ncbi:unnamed protein product, partial [Pylaiella littoralis]